MMEKWVVLKQRRKSGCVQEGYVWRRMGVDIEEQGGGFKGLCLPPTEAAA